MTVLTLCATVQRAVAAMPLVRYFSTTQIGAGTQTWQVAEDHNSRMFMANNAGLMCFDGSQWKTYYVGNYTSVRAVWQSLDHKRIYVGSSNDLGYFHTERLGQTGAYVSLRHLLPKELTNIGEVWRIMQDATGRILFQTKMHLLILSTDGKTMSVAQSPERIACSATTVRNIYVAGDGGTLYRLDGQQFEPTVRVPAEAGIIRAILPYGQQLLLLTEKGGLYTTDTQSLTRMPLDIDPYLSDKHAWCADIMDHQLAIGTVRGGAVVKNLQTGHTTYIDRQAGLRNNTVLSIYFDHTGNLWTGLDNGVGYISVSMPYSSLYAGNHDMGTGRTAYVKGSVLYMGTNQGLFHTPWPQTSASPQHIRPIDSQVWALTQLTDGTLLCASDGGLWQVQGSAASRIAGVSSAMTITELRHHPGYLIGSDYDGIFIIRRNGQGFAFVRRVAELDMATGSIVEDHDGAILLSDWQRGVVRVTFTPDMSRITNRQIYDDSHGLASSRDNQVASIGGRAVISCVDGFYRINHKTLKPEYDRALSRTFNTYGTPLIVNETAHGDIWATKQGFTAIARLTGKKEGQPVYALDSLSFRPISQRLSPGYGRIASAGDHTSLLPTINGFIVADTRKPTKAYNARLFVSCITGHGATDSLFYSNLYSESQQKEEQEIVVSSDFNTVTISYVMPEYRAEQAVSYRYRLEGFADEYSQRTTRTSKTYDNLPGGTYTFHVQATNMLTGQTAEASITFTVEHKWYAGIPARIIYILLILGAVWLLVRYMQQRAAVQMAKVRAKEARERERLTLQLDMEREHKEREIAELKSQQLEEQLKQKSGELGDTAMNLVRKNDMLIQIDQELQKLYEALAAPRTTVKPLSLIASLRHDIKAHMGDDDNWDKFEENFNLVYDNFMKQLTTRFPDLNATDRKLCAYLRMGMSSKDIATMLNTSVRSIETSRYRLRKKLQLDAGDNLSDFIQKLATE